MSASPYLPLSIYILTCLLSSTHLTQTHPPVAFFESLSYKKLLTITINEPFDPIFDSQNVPHPDPYIHQLTLLAKTPDTPLLNSSTAHSSLDDTSQLAICLSDFTNFPDASQIPFFSDHSKVGDNQTFPTFLEDGSLAIAAIHPDVNTLDVKISFSNCLVPLFFIDNVLGADFSIDPVDAVFKVDVSENPGNYYSAGLKEYSQVKIGQKVRVANPRDYDAFNVNPFYLKIYCPFWRPTEVNKMTVEVTLNLHANTEFSYGNIKNFKNLC